MNSITVGPRKRITVSRTGTIEAGINPGNLNNRRGLKQNQIAANFYIYQSTLSGKYQTRCC